MILKRDLIMGAGCFAGLAASAKLRPSRSVTLLGADKLAKIVPPVFGDWQSEDVGDPLAINGPGTLSAKLYNQLLVRAYTNGKTGQQVLMLLAYGGQQTDELQLHRPEVCYPAFGYSVVRNQPVDVPLAAGVTLPARGLVAIQEERTESIIYWSRIGEMLPRDSGEQRVARLQNSMDGVIPDGLLSRFSASGYDPSRPFGALKAFVPQLVESLPPASRKVLIGTDRGRKIMGVGQA